MVTATPSITNPVVSPITITGINIMMNAAASFFLSFIIFTKGEFEPSEAEFPKLAINTMENFAKISLIRIALNKSNPLVREIVTTKPIRYKTIATIPAEPVERS